MKVSQPPGAPADPSADKAARRLANLTSADQSSPIAPGRSFASVLDALAPEGEGSSPASLPAGDTSENTKTRHDSRPNEPERPDTDDNTVAVSTLKAPQPLSTTEIVDIQRIPSAREILPAADLDNIVLTVRTDLAVGQPQVTIDLPRSVLEGLRVTLTADRIGRISAELIARNDVIKSHIDARAPELVDMLRFRGVEVSEVRTSVSGDLSGQSQPDSHDRSFEQAVASREESPARINPQDGDSVGGESEISSRFTYRA